MRQILGQARAVDVLQRGLASGRVHHAFIFHGPAGVGKFTAAMALARVLLCHAPQAALTGEAEACGACPACTLTSAAPQAADDDDDDGAAASSHPDLHVVTKELARFSDDKSTRDRKLTTIPVDVLRTALLEPVYRAAQLPGKIAKKVFVVDEAELLNATGQNLLLKTLEEPPAGTVIILVTSSEDRLLPTIRSRCQRVAFLPLPEEVVRAWLREQPFGARLSDADCDWIVRFANGSLGRASLAARHGLQEWATWILPDLDRLADGKPTRQGTLGGDMAERIDAFAVAWVDAHDGASKEAANKLAAGLMWATLATHARRRIEDLAGKVDPADPVAAEARLEPWLRAIDAIEDAQRHLASNVNLSIVCDHLASVLSRVLRGQRVVIGSTV